MEPTITIIDYLWDSRNEWFSHGNSNCPHSFEDLVEEFLDSINAAAYIEVTVNDGGPIIRFHRMTASEWNDLIGPAAQKRSLERLADSFLAQAMEILQAAGTGDD